jgi:folate-binding protein YgfZ
MPMMKNTDARRPNADAPPQNAGAPPQSGRLPYLGVLRFTGPDSLSFLQGQLSNDTRHLAEGRGLLAAYSSPQGRVLALMHLLPHSSGVIAILPRDLVLPTLEGLRKFVLRAKVKIEDAGELLSVAGLQDSPRLQSAGFLKADQADETGQADKVRYTEKDGVGVAAVNRDPGRRWVIGAAEKLAEHGLDGRPLPLEPIEHLEQIEHDWRLADIRAGLPQIYLATREAFVAQMLNLDLLDGISFSKGCYTGQEIIARTQHLGRIKRRLYRLQLPLGEWRIGQPLRLRDGRAGRLTEVIRSGAGYEALAVLNVDASMTAEAGATAAAADGNSGDGGSANDTPIAAAGLPLPYQV